jgi:hypothetical protein
VADWDTVRAPSREKIGRQIVLPFTKAFEIAWKGIRIRIWRSLITMSGIILAIAFLTSVWTASAFSSALKRVDRDHELYALVQGVLEAEAVSGGEISAYCVVVEGAREQIGSGTTLARSVRDSLDGMAIFRASVIPLEAGAIEGVLAGTEGTPPDALIIAGWPDEPPDLAVAELLGGFAEQGGFLLVYGAPPDPAAGDGWLQDVLPAVGQGRRVKVTSGQVRDVEHVGAPWDSLPPVEVLSSEAQSGGRALSVAGDEPVLWWRPLGDGSVAWYPVVGDSILDPNHLAWFIRGRGVRGPGGRRPRDSLLVRLIASWGCREEFAGRQVDMRGLWLVGLSLLVCVVGITNAMLMSVTERFREIGTMKCLGALDKFIVKLFLIESSLQGAAGSLTGVLIGFALAFVRALFTFHVKDPETGKGYWLAVRFFPAAELLLWAAVALGAGVVLTIIAAIYPAVRAARMEPVQAMRAEA